jgi:predicted solute-binding protein
MRLASFRVGSVPYLNAAPLTYGLEREISFVPPSQLAVELHAGQLDAALVSVTEALFYDGYDLLDGFGITSDGPVYSVFLAHRQPLEAIREVALDPASCTSVNLLRVLLAERGLAPQFRPLSSYAAAPQCENVLLIGNPAIEFHRAGHPHAIWDLGAAWQRLTGLPFVYAVWALRRDRETAVLRSVLRAAAVSGLAALPQLIAERPEFDAALRRAHLTEQIRYPLGAREKLGLSRFGELLTRHTGRRVFPPNFR